MFDAAFLPALLAGALVIATHVPLGHEVLRSGIVFLDLAIAQAAGLGVILAGSLHLDAPAAVQLAAGLAALAAAALLTWSERRWPQQQEALIGSLFVVCACLGLLLLAANPHGGERLRELLVGQILWVAWADLPGLAMLSALALAVWFGLGRRLGRPGFYALFAITVTASVQFVGIYLVFATLILPALASSRLGPAWAVGAAGYLIGFALSTAFDLPAGAIIVCALAATAGVTRLAVSA